MRRHENTIRQVFEEYIYGTYTKTRRTQIITQLIYDRIRMAELAPIDDCWGESNDEYVHVSSKFNMSDADIQGTLLHEALHYIARIDRGYGYRDMCARAEHDVMKMLGEDV